MSHAYKTGLQSYRRGDKTVYAALITAVEPIHVPGMRPGAMRLRLGSRESCMHPDWCDEKKPQAGGYLVVEDGDESDEIDASGGRKTKARFETKEAFEAGYIKES